MYHKNYILAILSIFLFANLFAEDVSPGLQANRDFKNLVSEKELKEIFKKGEAVIYFRHPKTEVDYADQVTADVNNCSTQRVLSEKGVQDALKIADVFGSVDESALPVSKVVTSDYCRTWNAAAIIFREYEKDSRLNFLPFEDYTTKQIAMMKKNVGDVFNDHKSESKNLVVISHDDMFDAFIGIYPAPQGIAYVLIKEGDNFKAIFKIRPEEWKNIF